MIFLIIHLPQGKKVSNGVAALVDTTTPKVPPANRLEVSFEFNLIFWAALVLPRLIRLDSRVRSNFARNL